MSIFLRFLWFGLLIWATACEGAMPTPTTGSLPSVSPTVITFVTPAPNSPSTSAPPITPTATILSPYPFGFTPQPSVTPVLLSTSTATPTPTTTPLPTATIIPTLVPPIQTVAAGRLPPLSQSVLFLSGNTLKRWNHQTAKIETLVTLGALNDEARADSFSVSADGKRIALILRQSQIALFEINARQLKTLAHAAASDGLSEPKLRQVAISPDGQWVAYLQLGARPAIGRAGGLASPTFGGGVQYGMIYAVRVAKPDQRIEVGFCAVETSDEVERGCGGFLWSPDSRTIAWNDGRGVWVAELGKAGKQLFGNMLAMPNGQGKGIWRRLLTWSPQGRYVLGTLGFYEGSGYSVIDTQTGATLSVPDSFEYTYQSANINWLRDGRLLVLKRGSQPFPNLKIPAAGAVWQIVGNDFVQAIEFLLPTTSEQMPFAPAQALNGDLLLAIPNSSPTQYSDRGIYKLSPRNLTLRKVNGLPPLPRAFQQKEGADLIDVRLIGSWAPDGSALIVSSPDSQLAWYVLADGKSLYDIHSVIGYDACCFVWLK